MTLRPLLLLGTALLGACVSSPSTRPAVQPLAASTLGLGTETPPPAAGEWWTALADPQLDRIMRDALAGSPTLDAALARIRLAESNVSVRRAEQLPQVTLNADEQYQRLSEKYIIPPPYGGSRQWIGTTSANLSWNLDFWGRQRAMVAQARATASAAALDHQAARLALTGTIAQTYVDLVRAERLSAVARDFVTSRQQSLALARTRIRSQLASNFDARAAETLLAEARQAQVRADGQRALIVHALAALAGRGADYYPGIAPAALTLDRALPLPGALPADLLGRRPDLLAGQAQIDAAAAGRRVARTAFYPNINLTALLGVQALGLGNLVSTSAGIYGGGAALHLPIFDGGRIRADYAGATAQLDVAVADYNNAVVRAVREAADALSQVETSRADAAEQRRVLGGYQDVVRLDRTRVASGLGSQLDLLSSGDRVLAAEQQLANIEADAAIQRIKLLIAVGGDFQPLPAPQLAEAKQ